MNTCENHASWALEDVGGGGGVGALVDHDAVDISWWQVRGVLAELAAAGYIQRVSAGDGVTTVYTLATNLAPARPTSPPAPETVEGSGPPG